jgi:hypothetical protein
MFKDIIQCQAHLPVVSLQSAFVVVPGKEFTVPIEQVAGFTLIHITMRILNR